MGLIHNSSRKWQHFFALGIEADAAPFEVALICQQGRLGRAVADVDVRVRQFARAAAIQEIAHVLRGDVAWYEPDHRLRALLRRPEFVAVAIDEEPAATAQKLYSVVRGHVRGERREVDREVAGIFEQGADGIGSRAAVVEVVVHAAGGGHGERRIAAHKHVHHVEPVRAEIGELAAAEVQEGAEIQVDSGIVQ